MSAKIIIGGALGALAGLMFWASICGISYGNPPPDSELKSLVHHLGDGFAFLGAIIGYLMARP